MKAATRADSNHQKPKHISIHAAREGGDHGGRSIVRDHSIISIHAAREGGDCKAPASETAKTISIHAAREGGDMCEMQKAYDKGISIHAAREGGDATSSKREADT